MELRHVADQLDPLTRTAFRTLSPDLMESVAPSPTAMGVACPEFHQYLLQHKDVITHLTVMIHGYEGILHVIPSLEKLQFLDIRATVDIDIWPIVHAARTLKTLHVIAHSIRFPTTTWPQLKALRLISSSVVTYNCRQDQFPVLESLSIEGHTFLATETDLPQTLVSFQMSVATFPIDILESICLLRQIRHLSFDGSRLTYLPESFGELETLESLSLRGNFMTIYNSYGERDGNMLNISRLSKLRVLDLSDNVCLELGNSSIQFPENLEVLDVRSCIDGYYNEPFFQNAYLPSLEVLYTKHLPSRDDIRSVMPNLKTIIYADPDAVKKPMHVVSTLELSTSIERAWPRIKGIRVPCSLDGVTIYVDAPMEIRDVMTYADL